MRSFVKRFTRCLTPMMMLFVMILQTFSQKDSIAVRNAIASHRITSHAIFL